MATLVTTITETLRYRGKIGQWSWVFHRLSGLGIVLFVYLHVIDTSWAAFYPDLYAKAIHHYQSPLFTLGEFVIVAAVVYHAINGYRIIYLDWRPELWHLQQRAAAIVFAVVFVILIPMFLLMFGHVVDHYNEFELGGVGSFITGNDSGEIAGVAEVIGSQIQFAVGLGATVAVALVVSFGMSLLEGNKAEQQSNLRVSPKRPSELDVWFWKFMRVSGLLILPLVFGHLAMLHVIQGVFDITGADKPIVGTDATNISVVVDGEGNELFTATNADGDIVLVDDEPLYFETEGLVIEAAEEGEGFVSATTGEAVDVIENHREVGSALAFVGERWDYLVAGVAVWRFYDGALLGLIVLHGFYGLYLVMRDYAHNLVVRRALTWSIVFGAVVLILVGSASLIAGVEESARDIVIDSLERAQLAQVE